MTILLTGAGGFLGIHLLEVLLSRTEQTVIALTSKGEKLCEMFPDAGNRLTIFPTERFASLPFAEIDVLVNCAFPRNEDGVKMAEGLRFIAELLKAAVDGGVGAVINISSQSVYSQQRTEPATEETPLNLETSYAVGKYAAELLTNTLCAAIPHTNLRLASLIGAGFDQRVPNKLIAKALAGEELKVLRGPQYYGFLDVRDAADAITAVINSDPGAWAEVYNLGTNEAYTLEDIAKTVVEIYNQKFSANLTYRTEPSEKSFNSALNCRIFNKDFHWKPRHTLRDTIQWIFDQKKYYLFNELL